MMACVTPNRVLQVVHPVPLPVPPVPLPVPPVALPVIINILRVRDTAVKRDIPIITMVNAMPVPTGIMFTR